MDGDLFTSLGVKQNSIDCYVKVVYGTSGAGLRVALSHMLLLQELLVGAAMLSPCRPSSPLLPRASHGL